MRSKLFVPVPTVSGAGLVNYNAGLLHEVHRWNDRRHYAKEANQLQLFEEDLKVLLPLPASAFDARRYEERTTDKYGCVQVDGKHIYSVSPAMQREKVTVGIGAHDVTVFALDGSQLASHPRSFGTRRTVTLDYVSLLPVLRRNPGSWEQCPLREAVSPVLQRYIDGCTSAGRRDAVQTLIDVTNQYGFDTAQEAFSAGTENHRTDTDSVMLLAARIASGDVNSEPEPGPSLAPYDALLHDNLEEINE